VTTAILKFDEFELDLGRYELRRSGRAVKLEKIPMELLILLAEREGQLVTREEIIQKLWGDSVFVDTRQGINTAIRKIRLALKDDPDQPRILETVVGKGYRLAAPVTIAGGAGPTEARGDSATAKPATADVHPASMSHEVIPAPRPSALAERGDGVSGKAGIHRSDSAESAPAPGTAPISPAAARTFFLFIQVGYLIMYAAAFIYFPNIRRLGLPSFVPLLTLVVGLIGTAARIYLLSSVAVHYSEARRLFRQMFPGTLVLDVVWAASPFLLYHKLGELTLIFVAGMVFLPFSQRTLVLWIYGVQKAEGRKQ